MNDYLGVVSAKIVKEHRDLVIYRPVEITLLMSSGDEPPSNVFVITHFEFSRIMVSLKRLATNAAVSRIVKLAKREKADPSGHCSFNGRCTIAPNRSKC